MADNVSSAGPKSTFEAYRAEGDMLFKQQEFKKALESYNLVSFFVYGWHQGDGAVPQWKALNACMQHTMPNAGNKIINVLNALWSVVVNKDILS